MCFPGQTKGGGRRDRLHTAQDRSPKEVYVYPFAAIVKSVYRLQRLPAFSGSDEDEDRIMGRRFLFRVLRNNKDRCSGRKTTLKAQLHYREEKEKQRLLRPLPPRQRRSPIKPNSEQEDQAKARCARPWRTSRATGEKALSQ